MELAIACKGDIEMIRIMSCVPKSKNVLAGCLSAMALLIWFLASIPAYAQVVGATLSGTVTDESHAAIPKATVSILNVATGVATTVTTNADGIYNAPNLLPGNYQASISADGFQKSVQNGIVLTVGAQQVLNTSMKVGSVSQTVEVSTQAPDVELASSTINGSVSSNTISQLPLNGRSWTDLATLQPGVSSIHDMAQNTTHDRLGRGLGNEMSIDGGRPQQNNYLLNGVSINDYSNQAPGSILGGNLGADAVAEFTILTSNYSTEYGRSSGGVLSAITRSGTNQFHGSAYEFLRNSFFDARDPFDGPTIPAFRRNQFGASAGGPIIKDKTFIFGDYEGLREAKGLSTVDQVPSPNARLGILVDPNNPTQNLPAFTGTCPANSHLRDPNAAVCVSDLVLPWVAGANGNPPLYHLPDCAPSCPAVGDTASYSPSQSRIDSVNYFTTRVDHKFSDKDSVDGTFMYDKSPFLQPQADNNVLQSNATRRKVLSVEENHVFSPTLVNTVRFGWSHIYAASPGSATAINPAAADTSGIYSTLPGDTAGGVLGVGGVSDLAGGLSTATPAFFLWNSYQGYDNLFLTKGIHSLKFGGNVERILMTESDCGNCGGNFTFDTIQNFLTNNPISIIADVAPTVKYARVTLFGVYVQDDIRLRPNLTINAGLRYEMGTVPRETQGHVSSLHSLDGSQVFATSLASLGPSPLPNCTATVTTNCLPPGTAPTASPLMKNPSLRNFEPRLGFSWDPFRNGKTAVRGGFGMFDVQVFPVNLRGSVGAYPFSNSLNNSALLPGDFPFLTNSKLSLGDASAQHVYYVEQNPKRNYVMQWNLNIQREIAPNTTIMIAYVGSRGVHNLFVTDNSSIVLPIMKTPQGYLWTCGPDGSGASCVAGFSPNGTTASPIATTPLNTNFGRVSNVTWSSDSIFHALEFQVSKRMSHGLEAQVSYTYGRSMDTSSGSTDGDQFLNGLTSMFFFDKATRRGPSDFDVPHNLIASYTWDIPSPKGVSGLLGTAISGWEFGGIFQMSNGTPFTPIISGDPLGMLGDAFDIPNRVPGCNPVHGGVNYLNVNCFSVPTAPASAPYAAQCADFPGLSGATPPIPPPNGQVYCSNLFGNAGRNSVIGPRIVNFDMSLVKNTHVPRISETFNVQFRAEVFNIFNHTNFSSPVASTGCCNAVFNQDGTPGTTPGLITAASTTSRQMQLALKFVW
jgi:outer membrane receptor protein involved in Fe transport